MGSIPTTPSKLKKNLEMKVKFKKLSDKAQAPFKKYKTDAGWDLTATHIDYDENSSCWSYNTGIAVEIPKGYVGLIFPRSSVYKKDLCLANCVGVIDHGYTGEIKFNFKESFNYTNYQSGYSGDTFIYEIGERIGQLIILPYPEIEFEQVDELSNSNRGGKGFGSTGK